MKYFSLFTGIGGFEKGTQQAYENNREFLQKQAAKDLRKDLPNTPGRSDWPTCIGYSEIDKYAIQIYQKHFPNHKNYGDITKINERELPDFDLLCGGFPCQSFSIAGKRRGFKDTRGTLFFDIARIIREKQPRLILLENVKGLLSHDEGNTFRTIITTLDELGYDLQWQVLNSKNFGVPQNRERVFIVGHLRGTPRPEVFPFTGEGTENIGVSGDGEQPKKKYIATRHLGRNGSLTSEISGTMQASEIPHIIEPRLKHGKAIYPMAECPTIQTHWGTGGNNVALVNGIRRLTPTECERLQGFPDGWTEGVSDTQRYKTLGNAVTVNVVQAIVEKLLR